RQHRAERRPGRLAFERGEGSVVSGAPTVAGTCRVREGCGRLRHDLLILAVVLLVIDVAALVVVGMVQVDELAAAGVAVGEGAVGSVVEPLLLTLETNGFVPSERAVGDTGIDAGLLASLAGVEPVRAPGRALVGRSHLGQQHDAERERSGNTGSDRHGWDPF